VLEADVFEVFVAVASVALPLEVVVAATDMVDDAMAAEDTA
jgi:hypothetical protein